MTMKLVSQIVHRLLFNFISFIIHFFIMCATFVIAKNPKPLHGMKGQQMNICKERNHQPFKTKKKPWGKLILISQNNRWKHHNNDFKVVFRDISYI